MAFGAAGYYDGPMLTVANLTYLRPQGSHLFARAIEVTRKGKNGAFQIVSGTWFNLNGGTKRSQKTPAATGINPRLFGGIGKGY